MKKVEIELSYWLEKNKIMNGKEEVHQVSLISGEYAFVCQLCLFFIKYTEISFIND